MQTANQQLWNGRELRHITVMFVDIVRSSDILRRLDIEYAEQIFDKVITSQIAICEKHQGIVNQVMGDGLMCLFGAEAPFEGHSLQALLAAEEMLENCAVLRQEFKKDLVGIRIGINTGEVILKPSLSESHRAKYQVIGEPVHITDRILKLAKPNTFLISEDSKKSLQKYFSFKKANELVWQNGKDPIQLFEKVSEEKSQSFSPKSRGFFLRQAQLDVIQSYLDEKRDAKKARLVWLSGPAGFGKTYLAEHAVSTMAGNYSKTIKINFYSQPVSNRHSYFEQRILQNILPKDMLALEKYINQSPFAKTVVKDTALVIDCISDILGQKIAGKGSYTLLNNDQKNNIKQQIVTGLLSEWIRGEKAMFLLEDLHWANEIELSYIKRIMDEPVNDGALHLLCTSREAPDDELRTCDDQVLVVEMEILSEKQSLLLIQNKATGMQLPSSMVHKIYTLSGGNPYFIQEYIEWIKTKKSDGQSYQDIAADIDRGAPAEITNILYNKLAGLPKETVVVAKLASVQGMSINVELLSAMAEMSYDDIQEHLNRLEAADILASAGGIASQSWTFVHELLQKAIYNSISGSDKKALHLDIVRKLRPLAKYYKNPYQLFYHHASQSNDQRMTLFYAKRAAREVAGLSMHKASLDYIKHARKALAAIKGDFSVKKHSMKLDFMEIEGLFVTSRYAEAKRCIDRLLADRETLLHLNLTKGTLSFDGLFYWIKGNITKAEQVFKALMDVTSPESDRIGYIREAMRLCNIYIDIGHYAQAIEYGETVLSTLHENEGDSKFGLLVQIRHAAYSCLCLAYAELGNSKMSDKYFQLAQTALSKSKDYLTKTYVSLYLSHAAILWGNYGDASQLLATALEYSSLAKSPLLKPYALSALGLTLAHQGDVKTGEKKCREALDLAKKSGLLIRLSLFYAWYAEVLMQSGKYKTAINYLQKATDSAKMSGEQGHLDFAARLLKQCYAATAEEGDAVLLSVPANTRAKTKTVEDAASRQPAAKRK